MSTRRTIMISEAAILTSHKVDMMKHTPVQLNINYTSGERGTVFQFIHTRELTPSNMMETLSGLLAKKQLKVTQYSGAHSKLWVEKLNLKQGSDTLHMQVLFIYEYYVTEVEEL